MWKVWLRDKILVLYVVVSFQNQILAFFFDISTSTKFEIAIAIVILSNMITMAMDHYKMSDIWNYALFCLNIMFTTIYSLECIVKIVGLRQQYFLYAWNIFDFIIVLVSITGEILSWYCFGGGGGGGGGGGVRWSIKVEQIEARSGDSFQNFWAK